MADFFLGLVIMPFSLANELMGYWIFGTWWCDVHSAMDVLLCTASIMNLCLISLDRYWSITKAVEYLKSRTPCRAAVMITAVWIMSGLICIPPLLGWKVERPDGPLPQCVVSLNKNLFIFKKKKKKNFNRWRLLSMRYGMKIDYLKKKVKWKKCYTLVYLNSACSQRVSLF